MTPLLGIALAASSFIYVFLKAFQQRNVTWNRYGLVLPISYAMAAVEVFAVVTVARAGWSLMIVLIVGTASGLGALSAMLLHNRIYKESDQ